MSKARWNKEEKLIQKAIKPFGLTIEKGKRGHHKVRDKDGKMLIAFAGTPSEPHWYKNVINQLIKNGHLPGLKKW